MDADPYAEFLIDDEELDEAEEAAEAQRLTFFGAVTFITVLVLLLALIIGPIVLTAQVLQWFTTGIWAPFGVAQFIDWMGWQEPRFDLPALQRTWGMVRDAELGATLFLSSILLLLGLSRIMRRD